MPIHIYEVHPRKDNRGFHLISERLPFGKLWYREVEAAIGYAKFYSRAEPTEVRVFDETGTLIDTRSWDARMPSDGL